MHTLHTTKAFVVASYPNGESSATYKLFTEKIGMVYAHGRSVREMKSKNRYALQVGHRPTVTLVRGREVWRVTSAMHDEGWSKEVRMRPEFRRVLALLGTLLPVENNEPKVFEELTWMPETLRMCPHEDGAYVEALTVFRIVDILGYVGRPVASLGVSRFLTGTQPTEEMVRDAKVQKHALIRGVNSALRDAR